ncbi:Stress-response A/B barrel domain-containing protein [Vigna angularis]|uniref:Stress-response A/B barrel domain-containing protein n=1 Tax=Phaseolus angularis TaxID=3914 RepID=A0A8T0K4K2_PHAAN|nr:Stress-response A/B barrel domain-containing protein [Vigna angularis]
MSMDDPVEMIRLLQQKMDEMQQRHEDELAAVKADCEARIAREVGRIDGEEQVKDKGKAVAGKRTPQDTECDRTWRPTGSEAEGSKAKSVHAESAAEDGRMGSSMAQQRRDGDTTGAQGHGGCYCSCGRGTRVQGHDNQIGEVFLYNRSCLVDHGRRYFDFDEELIFLLSVTVIKENLFLDDIMVVDWVTDGLSNLVPPPGSALCVNFLKLKEGAVGDEVLGVVRGILENFKQISEFSFGENFSPGRAKGFTISSLAVFVGPTKLEVVDSNKELVNYQ